MKLISFGCSLTDFIGVKEKLSELLGVTNYNLSEGAGSNQLQVNRFKELIIEDKINSDDIIYWQITMYDRRYDRLMIRDYSLIENVQSEFENKYSHPRHFTTKSENIFDKEVRFDLLSHSPVLYDKFYEDVDYNQELQNLLSTLIMAKKITKKIVVVFGWDGIIPEKYLPIFKSYLLKHKIDFIDDPYLTYVINNELPFFDDGLHPKKESGESFALNVVYPKLIEIIKNEDKTI
jgi:hypothetical protein